jgi:Fe2+ or Zn2+ uptake regulation protein
MTAPGTGLVDAMDRAGHRLTGQRRRVAGLVAARRGHFTAADLVADAGRLGIGRATVFRSLDLFATLGLVERVDLPGGDHAYVACEAAHHHHAICTSCGRSFDVDDAGLADVLARIAQRSGFRVTAHRLEVFGRCADCGA